MGWEGCPREARTSGFVMRGGRRRLGGTTVSRVKSTSLRPSSTTSVASANALMSTLNRLTPSPNLPPFPPRTGSPPIPNCFVSSTVGLHGLLGNPPTGLRGPPGAVCDDSDLEWPRVRLPPGEMMLLEWLSKGRAMLVEMERAGEVPLLECANDPDPTKSSLPSRSWPIHPSLRTELASSSARKLLRLWRRRTAARSSSSACQGPPPPGLTTLPIVCWNE
jgi:hypothetical protein